MTRPWLGGGAQASTAMERGELLRNFRPGLETLIANSADLHQTPLRKRALDGLEDISDRITDLLSFEAIFRGIEIPSPALDGKANPAAELLATGRDLLSMPQHDRGLNKRYVLLLCRIRNAADALLAHRRAFVLKTRRSLVMGLRVRLSPLSKSVLSVPLEYSLWLDVCGVGRVAADVLRFDAIVRGLEIPETQHDVSDAAGTLLHDANALLALPEDDGPMSPATLALVRSVRDACATLRRLPHE